MAECELVLDPGPVLWNNPPHWLPWKIILGTQKEQCCLWEILPFEGSPGLTTRLLLNLCVMLSSPHPLLHLTKEALPLGVHLHCAGQAAFQDVEAEAIAGLEGRSPTAQ